MRSFILEVLPTALVVSLSVSTLWIVFAPDKTASILLVEWRSFPLKALVVSLEAAISIVVLLVTIFVFRVYLLIPFLLTALVVIRARRLGLEGAGVGRATAHGGSILLVRLRNV